MPFIYNYFFPHPYPNRGSNQFFWVSYKNKGKNFKRSQGKWNWLGFRSRSIKKWTETGHCKIKVAGSTWNHELHQIGSGARKRRKMGPSQTDEAGPITGAQNEVRKHFKQSSTCSPWDYLPSTLHNPQSGNKVEGSFDMWLTLSIFSYPIPWSQGISGAFPWLSTKNSSCIQGPKKTNWKGLPFVSGREGGDSLEVPQQSSVTAHPKEQGHSTGYCTGRWEKTQSCSLAPNTNPFTLMRAAGRDPLWLSFQSTACCTAMMLLHSLGLP